MEALRFLGGGGGGGGGGDPLRALGGLIGGGGGGVGGGGLGQLIGPAIDGLIGGRSGRSGGGGLYPTLNGIIGSLDRSGLLPAGATDRFGSIGRVYKRGRYRGTNIRMPNIYKVGERGSGLRSFGGAVQDFDALKAQCFETGALFEDDTFPASWRSLFYNRSYFSDIEWRRPHELVDEPHFITESVSRFDVCQGELGDCWLLAAVANLTLNKKLFYRVIPSGQGFGQATQYAGIFRFCFWQYGKWVEVVVDDRLPTRNGKLVYMHSDDNCEFWSALLEKAYAKLHGCYEALKGGTFCEAMEDFTGGVTEFYELQGGACPPNLLSILKQAAERGSLMGCAIEAVDSSQMEARLANGLIKGHAYSLTAVRHVYINTERVSGRIPLVRIRNPWGNEAEWNGAWSDSSPEWNCVSADERDTLGLTFDSDGEFWMSFKDFCENFTRIEICNLTADALDDATKKHWEELHFHGSWTAGVSAGGCRNNLKTFSTNPQYCITLTDHDEADDEDMCTIIVALMQKHRRAQRQMGLDTLTIGFAIYNLDAGNYSHIVGEKRVSLGREFFKSNASIARSNTFINLREVTGRFRFPPGHYVIVPSTYDADQEGHFLLRVFTERPPSDVLETDDSPNIIEPEEPLPPIGLDEHGDEGPPIDYDIRRPPPRPMRPDPHPAPESDRDGTQGGGLDYIGIARTIYHLATSCYKIMNSSGSGGGMRAGGGGGGNGDYVAGLSAKQTEFFARVAGPDLEVDAAELQQVLNYSLRKDETLSPKMAPDGFTQDTCRSIVAIHDTDRSGKLDFTEFTALWSKIRTMGDVFQRHDRDRSHTLDAAELREALRQCGLSAPRTVLTVILMRYGDLSAATAPATTSEHHQRRPQNSSSAPFPTPPYPTTTTNAAYGNSVSPMPPPLPTNMNISGGGGGGGHPHGPTAPPAGVPPPPTRSLTFDSFIHAALRLEHAISLFGPANELIIESYMYS